jgi:DNA-binding TFAR19-related protein (PDSD5 family)
MILQKYLKKIGVKSFSELNSDEKETYKMYEEALSGRKLTDEDVQGFLQSELSVAINRLTDIDLKKEDEIFRKVEVRFIKKIISLLESPKVTKQMAEKQLESMINQ